jgi:hypothetical protein
VSKMRNRSLQWALIDLEENFVKVFIARAEYKCLVLGGKVLSLADKYVQFLKCRFFGRIVWNVRVSRTAHGTIAIKKGGKLGLFAFSVQGFSVCHCSDVLKSSFVKCYFFGGAFGYFAYPLSVVVHP